MSHTVPTIPAASLENVLAAAREIARIQAPSIEHLLRHQGFGFEADRIAELVTAIEAVPEAGILPVASAAGPVPAFLCALLHPRRGDHGA